MNFNLLNLQYLKEKLNVDLEIGKTDFIKKFKTLMVDDEGYLVDGFFSSKKDYLGKIHNDGFILRKKRNFFGPLFSANARGKIFEKEGKKTRLEIEIRAYDIITKLGLLFTPITILILATIMVVNGAYPALLILIPVGVLFLIFQRTFGRKTMKNFRKELIKNLSKLA